MNKTVLRTFAAVLGAGLVAACVTTARRPDELPKHYRDFQIYARSKEDASDSRRVVLSLDLYNRGSSRLDVSVSLSADDELGFAGGHTRKDLAPGGKDVWQIWLCPSNSFRKSVLRGQISFGGIPARDLYVALEKSATRWFASADGSANSAVARVTGTHAPRIAVNWWRWHSSSSRDQAVMKRPLITLAADGESDYAIACELVPPASAGATDTLSAWRMKKGVGAGEKYLVDAVEDLRRCIQVMADVELPLTRVVADADRAISLRIDTETAWPHVDSYRLRTSRHGLVEILSGTVDGLRHGVYGLLTDHLDCHWFLPRELGEVIPRSGEAVIGQVDEIRTPSFFSVSGMSWGQYPRWDRRNRSIINRGRMSFGHAWNRYIVPSKKAYEAHPEWWARDRRGNVRHMFRRYIRTNFCSSNPDVLDIVAKKVNATLRKPGSLVASLDPNDNAPFCLCDTCLAIDRQYGIENPNGRRITDRLLHFSKEIYDRLEPENRGKYLGILVYSTQTELPVSAVPHKNHTALICNMPGKFDHTRPFTDPTSPQNRRFLRLIKGWGKLLTQFGFYDYYGHWRYFGPWALVHKMREDLPAFRDLGGTYLMIEAQPNFSMQGLNLYVAGRLAWDVDADVDVLLEELFEKYYGPASSSMRSFWLTTERYYALASAGTNPWSRINANRQMWKELTGYLAAAEAAVSDSDQIFKDRIIFVRDGFDYAIDRHGVSRFGSFMRGGGKSEISSRMKKKYQASDPYWPTMIRPLFYKAR